MDHSSLVNSVLGIIPELTNDKYKGQAGKVAVIGGCREYTGAPFFASYSALKVGADLSHVFCTPGAAAVIKTYSPELIVHPYLPDTADDEGAGIEEGGRLRDRAVSAVLKWLDRFDVLVVGPGLGRDDVVLSTVASIMEEARRKNIPMVIDADGLWLVNHWPELVRGYQSAILTPNAAEFRRLLAKLEVEEGEGAAAELARKLGGPVVVRKGSDDVISDGSMEIKCSVRGSLRRAGGQGDVLSGTMAAFVAWSLKANEGKDASASNVPPLMLAAYGSCMTVRLASKRAFEKHGRAMGATDVMAELGRTIDEELPLHATKS